MLTYPFGFISGSGQSTLLDNLVSWWTMDETSGTRSDSHGSNDLTDTNTVGYATGKVSNAASFISTNSEYLVKSSASGVNGGDRDFTIAYWAYYDTLGSAAPMILGALADTSAANIDWRCRTIANKFIFSGVATSTFQTVTANNLGTISTGTWYHVVQWHDATANTLNIQGDNGSIDTNSSFSTLTHQSSATSLQQGGGYGAVYISGRLDEVGFWDRVLTSDERAELYNSGSGIGYPG